jgi:thymidylate synthase (FAD)
MDAATEPPVVDDTVDADETFVPVHDHGFVELLDVLGDDRRCVAAARVSLRREMKSLTDDSPAQIERDRGLIERLMRDRHTSPFEHAVFQFRIRTPIFVMRQWVRHRYASYNEESGRYVALEDEFYVPEALRVRVGKAMDYQYASLPEDEDRALRDEMAGLYESARALYERLLARGVAREQARLVLPVAQYTTFLWTVNALGLMNFLNLRNAPHAQAEIQAYAAVIEAMFARRMPWTHQAFRAHWGPSMIR